MKVAVYTAIFGDFNPLRPVPKQTVDADYFCFTDNSYLNAPGWKTVFADYPRKDLHPRIRAKYFKVLFHYLKELNDYDVIIWIDGSIEIKDATFIQWCLDNLTEDMLLFKHPQRDCIFEEFKASDECRKYDHEDKIAQRRDYRMIYPEHGGLYACGVMIRKNTEQIQKLMNDWWHEILKYTYQDQVSFPVVCMQNNFNPATFEENQYSNKYFQVLWHDDVIRENRISVLMPVYNTKIEYLKQAVESVLRQTMKDFEFVIVDDGSTNEHVINYLKEISSNSKIKIIRNETNKGIAYSLNTGLEHCGCNLVARMDSDDVARPVWLEKMIQFFTKNPAVIICGCQIQCFGKFNEKTAHPAIVDKEYAINKLSHWIANHPGIVYKRDRILALGAYGDIANDKAAEDYYLWCKILEAGHYIYNVPDVLIDYRVDRIRENTESRQAFKEKCRNSLKIKYNDIVSYHMATMPERILCLKESVASILPQCDFLHIYLNGFKEVPEFLHHEKIKTYLSSDHFGDIGDVGKFFNCNDWTGYNFTVDDKIIYPADYTEKTIAKIEQYSRKAVVSYHGRILYTDRPCQSYYKDYKFVSDYLGNTPNDIKIHIPGTGVMTFHSNHIAFDINSFCNSNMSDIFIGKCAQNNNIDVIALQHAKGWMKTSRYFDARHSICQSFANNDEIQTNLINNHKWKKL